MLSDQRPISLQNTFFEINKQAALSQLCHWHRDYGTSRVQNRNGDLPNFHSNGCLGISDMIKGDRKASCIALTREPDREATKETHLVSDLALEAGR
jgi:hypothetical protein